MKRHRPIRWLFAVVALFEAFAGMSGAQIDPRTVDKLASLGQRPLVFFSRTNGRVDIDVSVVVCKTRAERLVQTAVLFAEYASWRFPIVAESRQLAPLRAELTFQLLGFTTVAILDVQDISLRPNGAASAAWTLAKDPPPRDFRIFEGSAYAQPLDRGRIYFRYRLSVESAYAPPEWLMTLVFDTLGRKFSRDALKALLRGEERTRPEDRIVPAGAARDRKAPARP